MYPGSESLELEDLATIDWGDGTVEQVDLLAATPAHDYAVAGIFEMKIMFANPDVISAIQFVGQAPLKSIEYVQGSFNALATIVATGGFQLESVNLTGLSVGPANFILDLFNNILASFDAVNLPDTTGELRLYNNNLTTIDLGTFPGTIVDLSENLLTSITGATLGMSDLNVSVNNLSTAEVNTILQKLDTNGSTGGDINSFDQSPAAPPSGAGITAASNLTGKGWTVTTD